MWRASWIFVSVRQTKPLVALIMIVSLLSLWILLPARFANPATAGNYVESPKPAEKNLYKLDVGWPKFPEFFTGQVFGVAVDPVADVVYVAQRGISVPKVLMFTDHGYFLQEWNTTTIEMPHGIFATYGSPSPFVWVTDVGNGKYGHTVKQYTPLGKLLRTLGIPGVPGSELIPLQFDQPAEVFVSSKGDVYIVDGDGGLNNRLIKLTQDLRIAWVKGGEGTGPSQFYIPHSVTEDTVGRVWVADRGNKRLQVFDEASGEWLGEWTSCFTYDAPASVRLTYDNKYLVVAQLKSNRIVLLSVPPIGNIGTCQIVDTIQLADDVKPHLVDVNRKTGAIYVAEIGAQQAQKFIPNDRK